MTTQKSSLPSIAATRGRLLALGVSLAYAVALAFAPTAGAEAAAPAWSIRPQAIPTNFPVGDQTGGDLYQITIYNGGSVASSGTITITDTLPADLRVDTAGTDDFIHGATEYNFKADNNGNCAIAGQVVTCTEPDPVPPGSWLEVQLPVDNSASASETVTNTVTVSGGGAPAASVSTPTTIDNTVAGFGFLTGPAGLSASLTNPDGSPDAQAGSHPYQLSVNLGFPTKVDTASHLDAPVVDPNDLTVNLPPGVVVNPNATAVKCTEAELESESTGGGCPPQSAVGLATVISALGGPIPGEITSAVYNMVAPAGTPAELGFNATGLGYFEHVAGSVRTGGDYGLTANTPTLIQAAGLMGANVTLWGNPSDSSHDAMRGRCSNASHAGLVCPLSVTPSSTPFLTMPSACSGPLTTSATVDSWQDPSTFVTASAETQDQNGNPVGVSGCDQLDFKPSITVAPDTMIADSPSGLNVDLSVPQPQNLSGLAEANLKDTTVSLPTGMSVNPSAADGLQACTPAQIGIDNANEAACPDASKIGSVEVDSPLLSDPLTGGVYIAQQNQNPFGSLLAIYLTAEADGALIKLAGHVVADPVTGQLTTTFDNNPQLPFTDFKVDFFGGPRAALATGEQCGTFSSTTSMSPWSGTPAVTSSDPFTISSGCVTGFSPAFSAGTQNAQAGSYSAFVLSFSRSDTDQNFSGLAVKLPEGMLAKLAGVSECSDAQLATAAANSGAQELASPSCPSGSQVGTVTTGAGVGPDPYFIGGKAYLTGPYKGAPYGLAVVVPAVAGPYDLGTVVVRQALYVDPTTAQVTAVSDPFPTILQGIPLRIRSISVDLNRPQFTINPTSCDPMSVGGLLSSTGGLASSASSRFQVGGCQALAFSPKLAMNVSGKGKTNSGDHPTLTATLTQPLGQANLHTAKVALPLSIALDPNNANNVCKFTVAAAVHGGAVGCPAKTIIGSAVASTPLLSQPLTSPVYLVQGVRCVKGQPTPQGTCPNGETPIHTEPSLLIPLRGQIALDLRAQTSVNGAEQLVTTFATIPDAAVSKFTLNINGGPKGLLVITGRGQTICGSPQVANANFGAQSGKTDSANVTMGTPCTGHPAKHNGRNARGKK